MVTHFRMVCKQRKYALKQASLVFRLSFKICVNSTEWNKTKLLQGVKPQLGLTP